MIRLVNLRRVGDAMRADFTIADGRSGSVSCSIAEYEMLGERALQDQAEAIARAARRHGYRAPEEDRFNELR